MSKIVPLTTPLATPLTVADAVACFLERDWSVNTRCSFTSDLKRFGDTFGERRVDGIEARELQAYLNGLTSRRGDQERPISPQSCNRHHGTLNNLFGWLEHQEELVQNPMRRVERRKLEERLPRPLDPVQILHLLARVEGNPRDRALISVLHGSGLRITEALSLNVEDLSLPRGVFRVLGKGNRERIGYLSQDTIEKLRSYLRKRGRPKSGPVFMSRQGRLSYARVRQLFKEYTKGLGREGKSLTIHQLRHTFGSERAGMIDAMILRDLMGHKSLRTTQQYAKVDPEAARKAFEEFERQRR